MRRTILYSAFLLLAGCQMTQPYYTPQNYNRLNWATMPFEQAKAECRYDTLNHNKLWDVYEVQLPRYKACMEAHGYLFGSGGASVAPAAAVTTTTTTTMTDKSALYDPN